MEYDTSRCHGQEKNSIHSHFGADSSRRLRACGWKRVVSSRYAVVSGWLLVVSRTVRGTPACAGGACPRAGGGTLRRHHAIGARRQMPGSGAEPL